MLHIVLDNKKRFKTSFVKVDSVIISELFIFEVHVMGILLAYNVFFNVVAFIWGCFCFVFVFLFCFVFVFFYWFVLSFVCLFVFVFVFFCLHTILSSTRSYIPHLILNIFIKFFLLLIFYHQRKEDISCCRVFDLFLIIVSLWGIHSVLPQFWISIQYLFSKWWNIISMYNIRTFNYFDILHHTWTLYPILNNALYF